ncbi:PREDICTED: inactive tyrosine-protein kinase 7-like [Dinoponera quadriceps]|uniref:Inactive tyrosine-protein kinase 7-like n=1 Tax=Dinoponera quadriceps TaxID=609295 RepID=A0A6P3WPG5_DINQU|nr:PREDICTED: inactive tyrosine-protein kinase 7-like [Dinoponera quadriceps]
MRRATSLLLLLCLLAPARSQDGDLYFSVSPAEHSVVEGLPVRLRCEAQPASHVKYSWKIDGQPLAPSPRRHQVEGDLEITRVNRILDSGNFVCVATHEETGYAIESSPAKIDVQSRNRRKVTDRPACKITCVQKTMGKMELWPPL